MSAEAPIGTGRLSAADVWPCLYVDRITIRHLLLVVSQKSCDSTVLEWRILLMLVL